MRHKSTLAEGAILETEIPGLSALEGASQVSVTATRRATYSSESLLAGQRERESHRRFVVYWLDIHIAAAEGSIFARLGPEIFLSSLQSRCFSALLDAC